MQKHFGSIVATEVYRAATQHGPLTSELEACLCSFFPAYPAPATRSKPSLEARSPRPEPPTPTSNRVHIMPRWSLAHTILTGNTSVLLLNSLDSTLRNSCFPGKNTWSGSDWRKELRLVGNVVPELICPAAVHRWMQWLVPHHITLIKKWWLVLGIMSQFQSHNIRLIGWPQIILY